MALECLGASGVGVMIALAWMITAQSFDIIPVQSLSFTGPSADMLMLVLSPPGQPWDFDIGLVPGVVLGSFLAALWGRELKLEGFKDGHSMRRYLAGALLMGFGGMLAGGCAVGAGVSGAAIFALTAWISLIGMWLGAGLTDRLIDNPWRSPGAGASTTPRHADDMHPSSSERLLPTTRRAKHNFRGLSAIAANTSPPPHYPRFTHLGDMGI
jgi:hypothetical protein